MTADKPQPPDRPRMLHRGQDPEGRRKLADRAEKVRKAMRDAAIAQDDALQDRLAEKLGVDLRDLLDEVQSDRDEGDRKIRRDLERYRKEAQALAARERREFDKQLGWALKEGNLGEQLAKAYHNPALVMKLCSEYSGEASAPAGLQGGSGGSSPPRSLADYHFHLYDEPVLGVRYVDTIHPYCLADAGSQRRGYARAWVTQRLTFAHDPPESARIYDRLDLDLSAYGYGESSFANVLYIAMTLATSFGGHAELLASITIEQDFTDVVGRRHTQTIEVIRDEPLSSFSSEGSIWLFAGVMAAPEWGAVSFARTLSYPTLFPAYGIANHQEPLGGPVKVHVDFRCEAEADHRQAHGEIGFLEADGHRIKVHQIVLRQAG